jgi:hypothetical protein
LGKFVVLVLALMVQGCGPLPQLASELGVPSRIAGDLTPISATSRVLAKSRSLSGWAPLARVTEQGTVPRGVATTVYGTVYVHSLKDWFASYPAGSVEQTAVLRHERVHAFRQLAAGDAWFVQYAANRAFRWSEEKAGFREEVATLVENGKQVDPVAYASVLSGDAYGPIGGRMVGYEEAYSWVSGVVLEAQGR